MLSYEIFINNNLIYEIEIRRIDDLTSKHKSYEYEWFLNDQYLNKITNGIVKHKYIDGLFILINKVNKQVHKYLKEDPETQEALKENFDLIKYGQCLRKLYFK